MQTIIFILEGFFNLVSVPFISSLIIWIIFPIFIKNENIRDIIRKILAVVLGSICFAFFLLLLACGAYMFFISINFLTLLIITKVMLANYISLLLILVIIAYIPDRIVWFFSPIIEGYFMMSRPDYDKHLMSVTIVLVAIIRFLNFKLWIYALSFFMVFISYVEKYGDFIFTNNTNWVNVRSVVDGAVITFIVFDRLIKLFEKPQKKGDTSP